MEIAYNHTWIFFIAGEEQGKTYQTKRIMRGLLAANQCKETQFVILDPNNTFGDFPDADRIVPRIDKYDGAFLDRVIANMRAERNIMFIGDDIDIFLKTGYDSKELDNLGKNIKHQSIGGIMHTHRPNFFNSRIYQIMDFVLVGYGMSDSDVKYLQDKANLNADLYATLKRRQFVLIPHVDAKQQRIIDNVG